MDNKYVEPINASHLWYFQIFNCIRMFDWIFGSKKEEEKKEQAPPLPEEDAWVYDFIKQYLISPIWKNPLLDYIEENCFIFEDTEENKF